MGIKNKIKFLAFGFLIFIAAAVIFLVFTHRTPKVVVINQKNAAAIERETSEKIVEKIPEKNFFVTGWIPYWRKNEGADSLRGNLGMFGGINPFAFGVNTDGSLEDTAKIDVAPWPDLFREARAKNVKIVPTILWADSGAMHKIFGDPELLKKHIDAISQMLEKDDFSGVDIDYEGKDPKDKDAFSGFIRSLSAELKPIGEELNCTVEARTTDDPPPGLSGTRAMSWTNDLAFLGQNCDFVRVMAYDQVLQIYRANSFEIPGKKPEAPNADSAWVEEVVRYFLKYVPAEKLVLGVPTYGWEFKIERTAGGYRYVRVGSINFPEAEKLAEKNKVEPERTPGGELSFIYSGSDGERLVTYEDAVSIKDKSDIAREMGLAGISLFKLDGQTDPNLLNVFKNIKDR